MQQKTFAPTGLLIHLHRMLQSANVASLLKLKWLFVAISPVMHGASIMKENDFFASPIITPSTKAEQGHDEDISAEQIIVRGLATKKEWEILCNYTLQLFERGKEIASKRGLILVDTKYEFGKIGNDIYLMDEVHTPDSSRYFYADGFDERQNKGERQKPL